ncbi:hypothetical protein D4764_04G0001810 [Takifugu flavidus]|uniref:Uncharacterized protein n=1 Tax=Takifugu flavidus TaxID=433684 RepID=A0A5C6N1S3_9TELE|nr:hypothetical protein D4764_04G0001810 [Takifugu flavidus]
MQILELGKQQAEEKELGDSAAERAGPTGPIGRGAGRGHSWEACGTKSEEKPLTNWFLERFRAAGLARFYADVTRGAVKPQRHSCSALVKGLTGFQVHAEYEHI